MNAWTITITTYDFDKVLTEEDCTAFLLDEYEKPEAVKEHTEVLFQSESFADAKKVFDMSEKKYQTFNGEGKARLFFAYLSRNDYSAVFGNWILPKCEFQKQKAS